MMSDKPEFPGNSIMVRPDGPLICKSDQTITLLDADGNLILEENEFALCRCGKSENKPFCDGTHKRLGISMNQDFNDERAEDINGLVGAMTITVKQDAMYSVQGPVTIFSRDGQSVTTRTRGALCWCGFSEKKPFCDVKHKKNGFKG